VDDEKTPKSIRLWMVLTILVTMCLMSTMVFQHLMHIRLTEEVTELKSEVRVLTMKSRNPFSMNWVSKREKRQVGLADIKAAEKSGVNVLEGAYQYGNDLKSESALSVYRTLMGEDQQSFGGGNNGQNGRENSNSYDDHNQLGVLRESSSNQGNSNAQSGQSSYARVSGNDDTNCNPYGPNMQLCCSGSGIAYICRMQRVNPHPSAHRHSRVASTPEVEVTTQTYIVPDPITSPKPMKSPKSMLKSLDSSRMFDTIGSPILSIHLQAKVSSDSADPSSTDLETGVHNSWRLSPWSKKLHGAGLFIVDEEEGQIEVPEAGLYLVYAQIEYMDVSETNGFEVDLDSEAVLSCVVTTSGSDDQEKKHNTCFTSAALFLQRGTLLNVRDKEAGRYSLLHSKGTFFGITKISSC